VLPKKKKKKRKRRQDGAGRQNPKTWDVPRTKEGAIPRRGGQGSHCYDTHPYQPVPLPAPTAQPLPSAKKPQALPSSPLNPYFPKIPQEDKTPWTMLWEQWWKRMKRRTSSDQQEENSFQVKVPGFRAKKFVLERGE
jgi:hypothetical protein